MTDVRVSFGTVRALTGVSLALDAGRVHAVVGQNGAGKTTLARVVAGMLAPDDGTVEVDGRRLQPGDVPDAVRAGVAMVHQHFTLPPSFTVAEALELSQPTGRTMRLFRRRRLEARWAEWLEAFGIDVMAGVRVSSLPIEQRQWLEIARCLATDARLLLLDEPTALLSPAGAGLLFDRIQVLAQRGVTIVVVLHKLAEVRAVADTVTVLRDGHVTLSAEPSDAVDDGVIRQAMLGDVEVPQTVGASRRARPDVVPCLRVAGVATEAEGLEPALADIDLEVGAGELVGVAGVEGNGQRALAQVVTGLLAPTRGVIELAGEDVSHCNLQERRRRGVRVVPFDRNTEALSLSSALWENHAISRVARARWTRRVDPRSLREEAEEALRRWAVRYRDADQPAGQLSGGNAQRLVLASELDGEVVLALVAHPTRGLDLAATAAVRSVLAGLCDGGAGVLLISSDLDELFELSTTLIVLRGGRVAGRFSPPYDRTDIGRAMVGGA